jgi:dTDP-4-dehydrorhamnose 3,5-epimerase
MTNQYNIQPTTLAGCFVIKPKIFGDDRGLFYESFNKRRLEDALGIELNFVQDNLSISNKNVIRGLHFQEGDAAQAKLVQVLAGKVLDVVVDLRKESTTFGRYFSIELSARDRNMLFIPRGMAHGFLSLENQTVFSYKCDAYYAPKTERGIRYNDPDLSIDWGIRIEDAIISEKDKSLPFLKSLSL